MKGFILALVGYALGTTQILVVEWIRERRAHERTLRVIRGELGRLATFREKFRWTRAGPPSDDRTPRPPRPIDGFIPLVASGDFRRTDEHLNDNTGEVLCSIADGCAALQEYHAQINRYGEDLRKLPAGAERQQTADLMPDIAVAYDRELDRLQYVVHAMIRDLDRRLEIVRLLPQLRRIGKRLPPGDNPPPVTLDDPRVAVWLEQQSQVSSGSPPR